ncbi:hypothetical protein CHS0354_005241 [Potamilus streckersoni]|uniref:Uncharacterized protein n=1 Tax=Potamilus streckersoni TaxID=2493646 RepID=A0AAE0TJU2_9BIVA|nr:hypothetical protein CHS0354_005241 [Potamilus streckersoni]
MLLICVTALPVCSNSNMHHNITIMCHCVIIMCYCITIMCHFSTIMGKCINRMCQYQIHNDITIMYHCITIVFLNHHSVSPYDLYATYHQYEHFTTIMSQYTNLSLYYQCVQILL